MLRTAPPVRELLELLEKETRIIDVHGLTDAARAFLTAVIFDHLADPITIVCPTAKEATDFARNLTLFLGEEPVLHYPRWIFFPLTCSPFSVKKNSPGSTC